MKIVDKEAIRVTYQYLLTERVRVEHRLNMETYSWDMEKVEENLKNIELKITTMQTEYPEYLI